MSSPSDPSNPSGLGPASRSPLEDASSTVHAVEQTAVDLPPGERDKLLVQLWADVFRHLSTLGAAAIAALLVLLEVGVVSGTGPFWVAVASMAGGTLVAFAGSIATVELVEKGSGSTKPLKTILAACAGLLGVGTGVAVIEILMG